MITTEHIVFLARKLHWTREEIGKLSPAQVVELINELMYQESVESYRNQYNVASILAAIYNTIPTKSGKRFKPKDFISGDSPSRDKEPEDTHIDSKAKSQGIRLPSK